jgi:hypothetical protein
MNGLMSVLYVRDTGVHSFHSGPKMMKKQARGFFFPDPDIPAFYNPDT